MNVSDKDFKNENKTVFTGFWIELDLTAQQQRPCGDCELSWWRQTLCAPFGYKGTSTLHWISKKVLIVINCDGRVVYLCIENTPVST